MAIAVPLNSGIYVIVLVHAIVAGYHGWSHLAATVPTSAGQDAFIATVVFAMPILAVVLLARGKVRPGHVTFVLSMLSSFIFGVVFHFILDTADLCANVDGIGSRMFAASAVMLATVEGIGFIWGGILLTLPYRWHRKGGSFTGGPQWPST